MADIKNFGVKGIASDVQMGKGGGRLKYDSANNRFDLTQSDGTTLENLRVGSVVAGEWTADVIDPQYGGTGQDFSSATGVVTFTDGTATAGTVDLSNTDFISGIVAVANGGTGASTASGARTNLGLGSIATQDANNVALSGGDIDGVVIGSSTAAAGSFTTLSATGGITGDLTGDVTGTVSDISNHDTDSLSEGSTNLYFTDARARSAISVTDAGGDGSLSYNSSTGVITYTGPSATEVRAHFSAGTGLNFASGEFSLADTSVSAGDYGSTTAIPVLSIDAQGRITSASTATISTSFDIAGDSGSDTVAGGDTLTFSGTANQIVSSVSDNEVTFALADDLSVANVTVTGTLNSDDITASQVTVDGDTVITGNLTVNGTQTVVNSTVVSVDDAVFRVNSDGVSQSAGLEANIGGTIETVVYNPATSRWELSGEVYTADGFTGDLTGDVTGNVTGDVTGNLTGDVTGNVTGNVTGDLTGDVTGNVTGDVTGNLTGDVTGNVTGDVTGNLTGDVTGNVTGDVTGDVTGTVSDISNHDTDALAEGSSNLYYTDARVDAEIDAYVSGGTGISVSSGTIDLDDTAVTAGSYGSSTEVPTFTVDAQGRLTAAGTASISTNIGLSGDSGTDTVAGGETINFAGGDNLTSAIANNSVTFSLDADISLDTVTATGAVEGGSLTDGIATLSSGSLTGGVNGTFSGTVTGGSLTDGSATLSGGDLTGAGDITASGTIEGGSVTDGSATLSGGDLTGASNVSASGIVSFGSLSDGSITINGFIDEDNMASDSATLVPTQQSVKAYVDSKVTAQDVDFAGDSGTGAVDLDSETLTIAGGTNLTTSASGQTLTVDLDSDISLDSVTATTFTGDLTGDVTGTVSDISNHDTDALAEGATNLYYTDARVDSEIDSYVTGGTGVDVSSGTISIGQSVGTTDDVTFNTVTADVTGDLTGTADAADALSSNISLSLSGDASGSAQFGTSGDAPTLAVTLANSGVTAGDYGSATEIPTFTVDSKGRLTAAGTASIATSFDIQGDNGADDTINGGEALLITGAANQIETTISSNQVEIAIVDGAEIANLTVTGTFTSDDITSSQISIDGDAVITGNLTVQGTQTIVESTTVQTADAIFRTNSNGSATDAGFEANTANGVKQILFTTVGQEWDFGSENVKADTFTGDLVGNADTASALETARTISIAGDATGSASFDGSANADITIDIADSGVTAGSYGSSTEIPTFTVAADGRLTAAGTASVSTGFDIVGDDGTVDTFANGDTLSILGGDNVTTATSNDTITVNLDSDITLDTVTANSGFTGDLTGDVTGNLTGDVTGDVTGNVTGNVTGDLTGDVTGNVTGDVTGNLTGDVTGDVTGNLTGDVTGDVTGNLTGDVTGNVDASSGSVTFGTLTDGTTSVDEIETSLTDNDSAVPTSGAVVEYVTNNAGDGLLLRSVISADSSSASFDIGTMPNVSGRTYYADKVVIKVGTAFSGGNFNHIVIKDNGGSGATTLVSADDADAATQGSYVIELDGDDTLTKGQAITVLCKQSDGTTDAVATAGSMTVSVHYKYS